MKLTLLVAVAACALRAPAEAARCNGAAPPGEPNLQSFVRAHARQVELYHTCGLLFVTRVIAVHRLLCASARRQAAGRICTGTGRTAHSGQARLHALPSTVSHLDHLRARAPLPCLQDTSAPRFVSSVAAGMRYKVGSGDDEVDLLHVYGSPREWGEAQGALLKVTASRHLRSYRARAMLLGCDPPSSHCSVCRALFCGRTISREAQHKPVHAALASIRRAVPQEELHKFVPQISTYFAEQLLPKSAACPSLPRRGACLLRPPRCLLVCSLRH